MEPVYLLCGLLLLSSGALSADVSGLGGACTPGTDTCTLNGAICDKTSKTCVCNDGYVQSGTECARKHLMLCGDGMCIDWGNTMCDSNKCKCDSSKGLVATAGSCACPSGQVMHPVEKKCMKIRGQSCSATADCYTTAGLICTSSTCTCDTAGKFVNGANTDSNACVCDNGYTAVNGACVALIGTACGSGVNCDSGLVCDTTCKCDASKNYVAPGTSGGRFSDCACKSGFTAVDGACVALIGTTCGSGVTCDSGLVCDTSCKCDASKNYVAPGTTGARFTDCDCATGYAQESGDYTCYKVLDQPCTADSQCISDMVCTSSKCACDTTKNYATGTANDVFCSCPVGSTLDVSMNKCLKKIGQTCGTASECYTGLVCTSTKCACDASKHYGTGTDGQTSCICASGYRLKDGVCLKTIGQSCSTSSECYTGLVCTGTTPKCACDASKHYGTGTDGETSCGCASGYAAKGAVCMKTIGQSCSTSTECYTGLVCTGTTPKCACDATKHYGTGTDGQVTCACSTGYTFQNSMCRLNVGQDCTRGTDSTPCVYTATCSKETDKCTCDSAMGYTASGSTCVCKSGYTSDDGYCLAPLDSYCTSTCVSGAQCFAGNTTYDPICLCSGGANTDNSCSNAVGLVASLTSLMAALLAAWRLM